MKTKRMKAIKQILFLVFIVFYGMSVHLISYAQDSIQDREIVIVLDCSKSMQDIDNQYLVFDFIKCLSAPVPRNCQLGIVAYNNGICTRLPIGVSYTEIKHELEGIQYKQYGNAGAGLDAAIALFQNKQADKRIIMISDGEIMMKSEEETEESVTMFDKAVKAAVDSQITIDILAIGEPLQEGRTIYYAAQESGGNLSYIPDTKELDKLVYAYLNEWGSSGSYIGKLEGTSGELTTTLPDCFMENVKIILIGEQQNENLTVNCKAGSIDVQKGKRYAIIDINNPNAEEIRIQMRSNTIMQIDAYLFAEYVYSVKIGHTYQPETQTAQIWLDIINEEGNSLLSGHLKTEGMELMLDGEKIKYTITEDKAWIEQQYRQNHTANVTVQFTDTFGNYYGIGEAEETIIVPPMEEEPEQIDWFFWSVIVVFIAAITIIFYISHKKKESHTIKRQMIDESTVAPLENKTPKNDFCGKIVIYVIHNKNDIDYPPESINLFARCRRDSITLEWILDTCNLPLDLKGAEKIIFKPGADRSLVIKNNSKASVLIGRALLTKGQSYNLYYHEKVTFIFDQEDAEIEVHYKDLKPNER